VNEADAARAVERLGALYRVRAEAPAAAADILTRISA
jgi:hypothetical protein